MKRTPWTDQENAALCALYFTMLDHAIKGQPYSKAAMIRDAQDHEQATTDCDYTGELDTRSRGSIEAKLMNASAAHRDLLIAGGKSPTGQHATMDGFGYRALSNYQSSLKLAMAAELEHREGIAIKAGLALLPDSHPAQVRRS